MRTTRIYVDLALTSGQEVLLPIAQSTHLLRVLRLRAGAALTLFNGHGGEYAAELIATGKLKPVIENAGVGRNVGMKIARTLRETASPGLAERVVIDEVEMTVIAVAMASLAVTRRRARRRAARDD